MSKLAFARGSYRRQVAKSPILPLHNRLIEAYPALTDGPVSAIARPGMRYLTSVGEGPTRKTFTAPGIFDDAAFVVSGQQLYRVSATTGQGTLIGTIGTQQLGDVDMGAVAQIEDTVPSRLWIADGGILWVYTESGPAIGNLQVSTSIADTDTVEINGTYYQWTSGSVDAGTPAGTSGDPWLVALGASDVEALGNLYKAINGDEGTPGTTYSTALTAHTTVRAYTYTATDLFVAAIESGTAGNSYTTTETGAGIAWGAATLQNGGTENLRQVDTPGDVGAISLAVINGYVIVVPVQDEDLFTVGKYFWIEPGDDFIDPLNFANAERSSDVIHQAMTYSDQFWLYGAETTEAWITTGDPDAPMQRYQGVLFDRGSWEGTAFRLNDAMFVIDANGGVFEIAGGQKRVSRPDIEERIRRAFEAEGASILT